MQKVVDRAQLIGPFHDLPFESFPVRTQFPMHFPPIGAVAHLGDDNAVNDDPGDKEQPRKKFLPRTAEEHEI